jgi:multidrug efflux pump subunit AcrB
MHPSKIAINHPAPVFIMVVMIITMGVLSYLSLPRESTPDIQVPLLIVTIPFPGASPEDVESLITHKVELKFKRVENLKKMNSTSAEGMVAITLEFELGFDVGDARVDVREALNELLPELPQDIEDPIITEINLSEDPILFITLSGRLGLLRLKEVAEDLLEDIEAIPGILEVRRAGGLEREVKVYVDPEKLRYYQLDLNRVSSAIEGENTNIPGGPLEIGPTKYLIRVPGEFQRPEEINDLVLSAPDQNPIFVRDVARVIYGFQDVTSRSRVNGIESVSLAVVKRAGENLLGVRSQILSRLDEYRKRYEGMIVFTALNDHGDFVLHLLRDLENNLITGFFLVLLVLLVVMGVRNALFVAIAIPMSFLLSMIVMEGMGFTLNFVVIFSLILALGMLVDNAIVVVENIYRHLQAGKSRLESARDGIMEVAAPVTASTLTTLVAFAPIMFMPGIMGEFMTFLPQTLIFALSASLFVALVVNPVLCSTMMKVKGRIRGDGNELAGVEDSRILRVYREVLRRALRHRWLVLTGTVLAFVGVTALYVGTTLRSRGTEFFPESEPEWGTVALEMPVGTTLTVSDRYVQTVEGHIAPYGDSLKSVVANVGQRRGFGGGGGGSETSHLSYVQMEFPKWQDWKRRPSSVLDELQQAVRDMAGVIVKVTSAEHGPPTGPPVNIELRGEDFARMLPVVDEIKRRIHTIPGLINLSDDFDRTRPEIRVLIDKEKTARMGLRTIDVATTVRTAFNGRKVSVFREGNEEYDIVVRLEEKYRLNPADLERLYVMTPSGSQVPLSELATVRTAPGLGSIGHVGLDRVITVSADAATGVPGPVLLERVRQALADLHLPSGLGISYTGESEDLEESRSFLLRAFFIAVFLIFLVVVAQFNSFATPFIILSSVVLSLMGVFIGLMIHDRPFSIMMTGIGTISLAGIVVNNAIVMIDFIRQLIRRGFPIEEAVILAGMVRLRPVLLTATTTVLGLLPVAVGLDIDFFRWPPLILGGESGTFWVPMALAVMYGLSVATLMTLVVVPVLFYTVETSKARLAAVFGAPAPEAGAEQPGDG